MTVSSIETVQKLIEEMQAGNTAVGSAWEFINGLNGKRMFAVFATSQFCDIYQSGFVQEPELLWEAGKFIGKYSHLN